MHRLIIRMALAGFGILISLQNLWGAVYDLLRPVPYRWMRSTGSDVIGIIVFLPLLCFCLYKLITYILLLRQGPRTAHGMIWEYKKTETTDSDGDTVTSVTHTIRLDDGEMIHGVDHIPQSVFRDGMMWDQFITPGTYVIITWYEKPFVCVALRPDPAHPVPATADERHRIADPDWNPELDRKLDETMDRAFAAAGNDGGSATGGTVSVGGAARGNGSDGNGSATGGTSDISNAGVTDDTSSGTGRTNNGNGDSASSIPTIEEQNPTPFKRFNRTLMAIMLIIIVVMLAQMGSLSPFGIQGVYKNMTTGLVCGCFVVWILVHMIGKRILLRRVGKQVTFWDRARGERVHLSQKEIDDTRHASLIAHMIGAVIVAALTALPLIGPVQTAVAGPQTVSVTYQGVERRVETGDDDDSTTIYADFHFRTDNGTTLTITTDWDQRTTIERQSGQEGRHLLLTYWGNDQNPLDRHLIFDNAKADPKYE